MKDLRTQKELFLNTPLVQETNSQAELELKPELLRSWQKRLNNYQSKLFKYPEIRDSQESLFSEQKLFSTNCLNPLGLTPLPIDFWRLSKNPYHGPAIYLVMDKPEGFETPILLYIGETMSAQKRWKGEHDCKSYLSAYKQALTKAEIASKLSIRFWTDVPQRTNSRRRLEQELIRLWLPPFNKETRTRWSTPFTAETS